MSEHKTVDVIAELDALAEEAQRTIDSLTSGRAKSGVSGLVKIKDRARDAARWARIERERERSDKVRSMELRR